MHPLCWRWGKSTKSLRLQPLWHTRILAVLSNGTWSTVTVCDTCLNTEIAGKWIHPKSWSEDVWGALIHFDPLPSIADVLLFRLSITISAFSMFSLPGMSRWRGLNCFGRTHRGCFAAVSKASSSAKFTSSHRFQNRHPQKNPDCPSWKSLISSCSWSGATWKAEAIFRLSFQITLTILTIPIPRYNQQFPSFSAPVLDTLWAPGWWPLASRRRQRHARHWATWPRCGALP